MPTDANLQKAYAEACEALVQLDVTDPQYKTVLKRIEQLRELIGPDADDANQAWIRDLQPDTVVKTLGFLVATFGYIAFETRNAWTTKATQVMMKIL